jgi:hypothetical protein
VGKDEASIKRRSFCPSEIDGIPWNVLSCAAVSEGLRAKCFHISGDLALPKGKYAIVPGDFLVERGSLWDIGKERVSEFTDRLGTTVAVMLMLKFA